MGETRFLLRMRIGRSSRSQRGEELSNRNSGGNPAMMFGSRRIGRRERELLLRICEVAWSVIGRNWRTGS